jgi:hypothetical protein
VRIRDINRITVPRSAVLPGRRGSRKSAPRQRGGWELVLPDVAYERLAEPGELAAAGLPPRKGNRNGAENRPGTGGPG